MTPASDSISSHSMAIENESLLHVCNLHSFHIHSVHAHQWDNIQQQEKYMLFSNISKTKKKKNWRLCLHILSTFTDFELIRFNKNAQTTFNAQFQNNVCIHTRIHSFYRTGIKKNRFFLWMQSLYFGKNFPHMSSPLHLINILSWLLRLEFRIQSNLI